MHPLPMPPTHHLTMHMITLGACLDAQAEHLLESAVYQAQEAHGQHILLNLQALTKIDSRGLGKLFLTYHHLNRQNILLSMVNPRPMVREMLEFVNFTKLVRIYDSLDEVAALEYHILESPTVH
jgi:anti-anti-sigma factor